MEQNINEIHILWKGLRSKYNKLYCDLMLLKYIKRGVA